MMAFGRLMDEAHSCNAGNGKNAESKDHEGQAEHDRLLREPGEGRQSLLAAQAALLPVEHDERHRHQEAASVEPEVIHVLRSLRTATLILRPPDGGSPRGARASRVRISLVAPWGFEPQSPP